MQVVYATSNLLQLAFDCEPWTPTLPDGFVCPNEFGQLPQRLSEGCRSGKQKATTPSGNLNPCFREKFPTGKLDGQPIRTKKNPPRGAASDGESQRGRQHSAADEMYHCAQGWKNGPV
jgi:hypothetical protein